MKNLWTRIVNAVRNFFQGQLFLLVWPGMKSDTDRTVNNKRLQQLAFDAAKAAAEMGLKGGEAREAALKRLKSSLAEIGLELADRLVDTLLQVAYMQFRETTEG